MHICWLHWSITESIYVCMHMYIQLFSTYSVQMADCVILSFSKSDFSVLSLLLSLFRTISCWFHWEICSVTSEQKVNGVFKFWVTFFLWASETRHPHVLGIGEATPQILCPVLGPEGSWWRVWSTVWRRSDCWSWACLAWRNGSSGDTSLQFPERRL